MAKPVLLFSAVVNCADATSIEEVEETRANVQRILEDTCKAIEQQAPKVLGLSFVTHTNGTS